MDFEYGNVGLERISVHDIRFRITTLAVSEALLTSIRQVGLINPPVLLKAREYFEIVSGFNRVAACRKLGMLEIRARILDSNTSLARCAQIAIADNTSQRSLNLMEQARSLELLASCYQTQEQLLGTARSLGLAINAEMAGKLRKLADMNDSLKTGVAEGAVALPVALQLQAMNDNILCDELTALLVELCLSLNRQREILDWAVSICRRDNLSAAELLLSGNVLKIRQDAELDRRQKGQLIRDELRRRRYPEIVRHEESFALRLRRLHLPRGTRLIPPQHFESPVYTLNLDFQDRREFSERLEELQRLAGSGMINVLWEDSNVD